ncbi:MAG: glycosyltransferase family 2 protein [Acidobacteriota bacterium]|nr:glycosyltransferase family 2 protein [Acidobacteriota bacterium]
MVGPDGAASLSTGAPPTALTRREARARWTRYRADVWLTLAEVRRQRARLAVLRRLRPGSWPFRVVVALAAPFLAARRAIRRAGPPGASVIAFPFGEEPPGPPAPASAPGSVVTLVVEGPLEAVLAAANAVLEKATWLILVDPTDRLLDGAVPAMVAVGVSRPCDVVYGDERRADAAGQVSTIARPGIVGWVSSLSYDVTGRAVLFRCAALRALGGFASSAGWDFRRDAVIRLVESGAATAHAGCTVIERSDVNPRYGDALAATTAAALGRRGGGEASADHDTPGLVRWRRGAPAVWPAVSVVIPTRDRLDLLGPCLAALEERTTYPSYEVVIVDNGSVEPATRRFLAETRHVVVDSPGPFNYAAVVNRGVAAATGEFVVTLNNDVTIATDDWLEQMVGLASLPGIGVVGAYLQDPAGHPQHEGVAIAPYPQHLRRDRNYLVPDAYLEATREVAAVTGACQLVRRDVFEDLGGLDESLAVVHNDIDFCLRADRRGWRTVYAATVRHLHAESSSRGALTPEDDIVRFIARWDVFGSLTDPWFPARWELVGDVIRWRRERT